MDLHKFDRWREAAGIDWYHPDAITFRAHTIKAEFYEEKIAELRSPRYSRLAAASRAKVVAARGRLALAAWMARRRRAGSQPQAGVR